MEDIVARHDREIGYLFDRLTALECLVIQTRRDVGCADVQLALELVPA